MRCWDSVECGADIFRGAISIWRRSDAGLLMSAVNCWIRNYGVLTLAGKFICGGGRLSSETSRCWFKRSVGIS